MIRVLDSLTVLLPILVLAIALLLACAVALALARNAGIVRRGAASSSLSAVADDPFFYPFGEMPIVPRERHLAACDFRAWGIPPRYIAPMTSSSVPPLVGTCDGRRFIPIELLSAGALRRNESGGRPASLSGTAVVLTFPKRGA